MSKLGKEGTYMSLMESLMRKETKHSIVSSPTLKKEKQKRAGRGIAYSGYGF